MFPLKSKFHVLKNINEQQLRTCCLTYRLSVECQFEVTNCTFSNFWVVLKTSLTVYANKIYQEINMNKVSLILQPFNKYDQNLKISRNYFFFINRQCPQYLIITVLHWYFKPYAFSISGFWISWTILFQLSLT